MSEMKPGPLTPQTGVPAVPLSLIGQPGGVAQLDGTGVVPDVQTEPAVVRVVVHGAVAATTRPATATFVHWIGSVAPTNVATNDEWTDTANKVVKRWNGAGFDSLGASSVFGGSVLTQSGKWAPANDGTESNAMGAQVLLLQPFYLAEAITLTGIGVVVAGGIAGGLGAVGIYSDVNNFAGALLVSNTGALFDCSTSGAKTLTGLSVAMNPGRYWSAWLSTVAGLAITMVRGYARTPGLPAPDGSLAQGVNGYQKSGLAALPANAPAESTLTTVPFGVPTLFLQKA